MLMLAWSNILIQEGLVDEDGSFVASLSGYALVLVRIHAHPYCVSHRGGEP